MPLDGVRSNCGEFAAVKKRRVGDRLDVGRAELLGGFVGRFCWEVGAE